MADRQHARQLRAALSYRHKVKRLGRENDEARRDSRIDEERHHTLRTFYNSHGLRAEAAIAKVRNLLAKEQHDLKTRNAAYQQERDALSVRAAAGEVQAASARERHRKLNRDIDRIGERLAQLETLLNAHEPMALGGFIDLPLDEYTIEPPPAPSRSAMVLRGATAIVAVATALIVFLPWFGAGGGRWALDALPQFIHSVFPGTGTGPVIANLWVIAFALPLVACPLAAMARSRPAGQGTAIVGACTVLIAIVGTIVGSGYMQNGGGIGAFIGYLQPAYFAYLFSALAVTLLGTVRAGLKSAGIVSIRAVSPAIICACLALFLSIAGVFSGVSGGRILAQVDSTDVDRGIVRLYLGLEGHSPGVVHVPWPPDASYRSDQRSVGSHLGVELYVRETAEDDFRFVADSLPYWDYGSRPPGEGNAVDVNPGSRAQIVLDLRKLKSAGIDGDALRIDITSARGNLQESVMVPLPNEFGPTSVATSVPVEPTPRTVETPEPTPAPMPRPAPAPAPPRQEPEPVEEVAKETYITFSAEFGGGGQTKAVLVVSNQEGDTQLTVEPGQTIVGAWYLDRLESRPTRAIIRHRGTREERIIQRREYTTLLEDEL